MCPTSPLLVFRQSCVRFGDKIKSSPLLFLALSAFLAGVVPARGAVVINEIMFHPAGTPEPTAQEWIELLNTDAAPAAIGSWRFTQGINFTIPAGTTIPAGGYLVVAADRAAFLATHPGFAGTVVGGWTGRLSNTGERIRLNDSVGNEIDEVTYADQGDWALRARGVLQFNHRGWMWVLPADGEGSSLELRNRLLGNGSGQNWGSSAVAGGTPGAVNSVASGNVPPLIKEVRHRPEIPRTVDPVIVSCELEDELPGTVATLRWRLDGAPAFQAVTMTDLDGDGRVEATIPAQPTNVAVVEWYISASDGTNSRTWPAVARTSNPGVSPESFGQVTNALIQFDDAYNPAADFTAPGNQPIYRIIMTNAERAELAQIGSVSADADSDAEMNATFISHDGTGIRTRYLCGVRNRGNQTRLGPPNNYHVNFPSDATWNSRTGIQINSRFPHSQALGAALYSLAGVVPQEAAIVQVRVNGANLAESTQRMYGRYVRLETLGSEWVEQHFPDDPDGNLYRLDDHAPNPVGNPPGDLGSGEFRYEGANGAAYADTFLKETNKDDADFTDVIEASRILSAPIAGGTAQQPAIPNSEYPAAVETVFDLDQFYSFIAADALVGNQEGGVQTGRADDCSIYGGVLDRRFRWIPHDLDDVFDIGAEAGNPITRSIFTYDTSGSGMQGLTRLFNHPELVPRYYAKVLESIDRWFNSATIDPIIEQIMGGWVPVSDTSTPPSNTSIAEIKAYIAVRRANVLNQIQQNYALNVTAPDGQVEGIARTLNGSATINGTFNVARTYSITVNGVLAEWFYRNAGAGANAGTWRFNVAAGSNFLKPGLNKIIVNFWDRPNGTGKILQTLTSEIIYEQAGQTVGGLLQPGGSASMIAPSTYVPGIPILVRMDLRDAEGNLDRLAWTRTATLSANAGQTLTPNTLTLYNGMGSALVTVGTTGSGTTTQLVPPGGTLASPNANAPTWRILDSGAEPPPEWRSLDFDDSAWRSGFLQAGAGDNDERTTLNNVPGSAANTRRAFYFRRVFNVADPSAFSSMQIRAVIDDGAIFYLNGNVIQQDGMPPAPVSLTTPALSNRSGSAETQIRTFNVSAGLPFLQAGANILAVEVHNYSDSNPTYSGDLSFDCELNVTTPPNDPGSFVLSASVLGQTVQKAITSTGAAPTMTNAGGTLPAGTTVWNGIVRVSSDVTVPTGATLQVDAGTIVLVDGTSTPGDTGGRRIVVNGALNVNGNASNPVQITSSASADRWGQILFANAQPSTLNYTLLSRAGHAPGAGHTGRGPMLRLNSSNLTVNDSVISDGPAKALYSSGTCDLVLQRSLITRMITGPELENGCSFLAEDSNIQLILPDYRESNSAAPDDEDCLYIHNGSGRPVNVRRCAFVRCGDDIFDCLGGPINVEDSILREGWDKGMSLLDNNLTITRTLIIDCDKAIVPKSSTASTRVINVDRCTISSEDHDTTQAPWGYSIPPSNPDPDTPSTGLYTQNKSGQSDPDAVLSITATNTIMQAKEPVKIDAPYNPANTIVTYSCTHDLDTPGATTWPGVGNFEANPLFVDAITRDVHLQETSPCRDTGNPAQTDPDGSRADVGALPYISTVAGVVTWTPAGGPYRITSDLVIPSGLTLTIQAGTSIYFNQARRMTINGTLKVLGTAGSHVVFSHPPGVVAAGDADPIAPGVQTGPPKWEGIRIVGPGSPFPMSTGHEIRYADFINAQPAVSAGNQGALGILRAEAVVDHCTWRGTHLRMLYGRNCSLTVTNCVFPDMFDPLDDSENPTSSGYNLDNIAEQLKVEFPETDPQLSGNPNYVLGLPVGGHWRVYYNEFNGNKGHNDVFDADSGRWGQTQLLDCRYNYFRGLTGDEHIDLGGDAYIASNIFERCAKDKWTNDRGYANCISSGDKGSGTTIWVVRNLAFDVDHVINCKVRTGTIFEHNTVANLHPDFDYASSPEIIPPFTQAVKGSAINLFVPEDVAPQAGDGAYVAYNLFHSIPRVITWADMPQTPTQTVSKLEAANNFLNAITDNSVGPDTPAYHGGTQHPGGFTALGSFVAPGDPLFIDPAQKNYSLRKGSPARGTAAGGMDYGASVAEWAYVIGGPPAQTAATNASFTIGGPGIVAYKWRLDGGAWSAPIQIGAGGVFPRGAATTRTATLNLNGLTAGSHTLDVLGQDPAGNWQDADPARDVQVGPTTRTWVVNPTLLLVQINEVRADSTTSQPDAIELYNAGGSAVSLDGWSLTDDPAIPAKYVFPAGTSIPANDYLFLTSSQTAINLDKDGDAIFLFQGSTVRDSVLFGHQIPDFTIGRSGLAGTWTLCTPTLGIGNLPTQTGDLSAIRINEWFAAGVALYDHDWVELANASSLPVDLSGMKISDGRDGAPHMHTVAPLSFIAVNGYVKFIADGNPESGPTHLDIAFDAEQECIAIYDPSGVMLDNVYFYTQTTDLSMWRDGSAPSGYGFRELPTGGFEIATTDPVYINALALLRGLRITEVMFNAIGGNDYEYVELRNIGATPLQLAGVKFVEGIDFVFPSMTLDPGQNIVVVKHLARFRARYGNTPVVAGLYTGNLDASGETLALQLPPPFDANVLTFRYSDTWYAVADGLGAALYVGNPLLKAFLWEDRETWLPSELGGSPGGILARSDNYTGWSARHGAVTVTDDDDRDGVAALVEFGLGMRPDNPNGIDGRLGSPLAIVGPLGQSAIRFLVPQNAGATQSHGMLEAIYTVEATDDFITWNPVATKGFSTSWTGTGSVTLGSGSGGYIPVTVEDNNSQGQPRRFLRLQVGYVP
jgi:hypothetical protein